ncbi:MAG: serine protease precursor [uncultured bacterium]|nr:MAG: serine protease precursor [uncultured bacterium]OGJ47230.1 MAG: hypothetical protein A2244_00070 [Candidatus Peregrinibacteria bacterium RIFOXYA2_FULL_41_18]OGJ49185.1 MAG: hypothetical protein A2344_04630 [Candidatus Peregrinibacteria bacterium RIFOXYB12_FULL_41_12]OGJ53001.1 MAG: hypothetical protein A2336_03875 [Candidatus Peregrinibacteria bacterium RIFOXYB2_FULL_41_88]OGJ53286.1 MAG: hypothetical protein A2448_03795 [Candidatus Peregrinibacteria bacterium RIFOXYC2_FULL_41_22]
MPKINKKKLAISVFATAALTITFAAILSLKTAEISENSIAALKELNSDYGMVMTENLLEETTYPQLMVDIFKADEYSTENRGLIANTGEDMVLLQPIEEISDNELNEIARKYNEKVPEIHFEIDQEVSITEDGMADGLIEENIGAIIDPINVYIETSGNSVRVAVIDTGIQEDHPRFANASLEIEENSNVMDGNSEPADDVGHGTHIAGIIAKNAENSIIIPFKIVNKDGGKLSDVIKAIDQSIDAEVDVINISLGVQEASFSLEEIVEKASEKGVIIVAAAGNFSSSEKFYPAAYEETISVAATYYSGKKLESSNYGDWIDVAAKGYHIYSSVPYNDYGFKNGTSQAAAIVTAKVSKLLSDNPDMTFDSVIEALSTTSSFVKDDELSNVPIVTLY